MKNLDDLYRIYCAGFVNARLGPLRDPAGLMVEETKEGMFSLALGVEHGSKSGGSLKGEAKFRECLSNALCSEPVVDQTEEEQIEGIVNSEAGKLGSWATGSELFSQVQARMESPTFERNRWRIIGLCNEAAKRHNDGLEEG